MLRCILQRFWTWLDGPLIVQEWLRIAPGETARWFRTRAGAVGG